MDKKLLSLYAEFLVKTGVNVQKGQTLIIKSDVRDAYVARECATVAYECGAKEVVIKYGDEQFERIRMEHTALEVLTDIKPHILQSYLDYAQSEGGACLLNIISDDPEIFKGLDSAKIDKASITMRKALMPWRSYTMADKIQWCIAAVPSEKWAAIVFPDDESDVAVEKLWTAIFDVCRISGGKPVEDWATHTAKTAAKRDWLNEMDFDRIRIQSGNGTDLTIGLADDHVWEGVKSYTEGGVAFTANVPTEEVFTAPHRDRVDGIVKGTKPYVYHGDTIENFEVTFKDGKVIDYTATKNKDLLGILLDTDEGARHIGEIALVPASSPINQCGVLFYNTLFDENAACHIAFGAGYPGTVKGGTVMTTDELLAKGVNDSAIHEDVMIGASDSLITGYTKDNEAHVIFKNGEWA